MVLLLLLYAAIFIILLFNSVSNRANLFKHQERETLLQLKGHELVENIDMEHIPHIIMRVQPIIWKVKHFQIFEWVLCPFHLSLISCPRKANPNPGIH